MSFIGDVCICASVIVWSVRIEISLYVSQLRSIALSLHDFDHTSQQALTSSVVFHLRYENIQNTLPNIIFFRSTCAYLDACGTWILTSFECVSWCSLVFSLLIRVHTHVCCMYGISQISLLAFCMENKHTTSSPLSLAKKKRSFARRVCLANLPFFFIVFGSLPNTQFAWEPVASS